MFILYQYKRSMLSIYKIVILNKSSLCKRQCRFVTDRQILPVVYRQSKSPPPFFFVLIGFVLGIPQRGVQQWLNFAIQVMELSKIKGLISVINTRYSKYMCSFIYCSGLPVNMGQVFLGLTSTKQSIKCLAQGHNAVRLVRLKPATLRSGVKHSTTEPLRSSRS